MVSTTIWLKMALTTFFWALMFYLGKFAIGYVSPETVSGWRFLLGALVVMPWVSWREGLDWQGLRRNAVALLVMAVLGIGGFNLALFHGMKHTSAMNGALIMALCPVLIMLFSRFLTGDQFRPRQWLGVILAVLGVTVVICQGSLVQLRHLTFQQGDLLVLLAACCWALYSTIPKRFVKNLAPLQITASTVTLSSIVLSVYAQTTQGDFFQPMPWTVVAALMAMGLFGSGIAYLWWNDAVRKAGASTAAIFMNLVPIYSAMIGVGLGQPLTMVHISGTLLVLTGVWLSTSMPAKAVKPLVLSEQGAK